MRTRLLRDALQSHPDIISKPHKISDYIVEDIEILPEGELWYVGS